MSTTTASTSASRPWWKEKTSSCGNEALSARHPQGLQKFTSPPLVSERRPSMRFPAAKARSSVWEVQLSTFPPRARRATFIPEALRNSRNSEEPAGGASEREADAVSELESEFASLLFSCSGTISKSRNRKGSPSISISTR